VCVCVCVCSFCCVFFVFFFVFCVCFVAFSLLFFPIWICVSADAASLNERCVFFFLLSDPWIGVPGTRCEIGFLILL
jgi:hypothetical protein